MTLHELEEIMKQQLEKRRFLHSIGVEEVSFDLALIHGYDTTKASIAGILHDCAKHLADEQLLEICENNQIPVSKVERQKPDLLHAKVGAFLAKTKYGIEDMDILHAITYHTTGRPNMSLLEKIVFTADYIEPNRRPIPNLDVIRSTAYENLDLAVYRIAENVLNYLQSTDVIIDDMTNNTYEFYKNIVKNERG